MMFAFQVGRIGSPLLGIIVPAIIFGASLVLTLMLYRHFARRPPQ
jgi:hypothetical protein